MSSPDTAVGFDLKRLKVYSSCLRCRAKKVKCDRKEPCSRCVHHRVECSYRELASVKLDIRPFKRHTPASNTNSINIITTNAVNKPKTKKDTKDTKDTPMVPVVAPTPTFATTANYSFSLELTHGSSSTTASTVISPPSPNHMSSATAVEDTPYYLYHNYSSNSSPSSSPHPTNAILNPRATDIESSDIPISASLKTSPFPTPSSSSSKDRAKVHKIHRRKPSVKVSPPDVSKDGFEQVDRVKLSEFIDSSKAQENYADVPIWRAQAIGKHTQTAHEQDMADTFGLAAYLQAREMEIRKDPGKAGQTIDYEMELEMALAQRMPTSFSRSDRLPTRSSRRTSFNPNAAPYARPSYCQLSPSSSSSYSKSPSITSPKSSPSSKSPVIVDLKDYTAPPQSAQCCCQIAAQQGRAFNSCPYSNVSHSGYEKPALVSLASAAQSISLEGAEPSRIAYSPSYTPEYEGQQKDQLPKLDWSSILPPPLRIATGAYPSTKMDISSPTTELAPIRLPIASPTSSTSSSSLENTLYQVGRDDDEPVQIECKYNEPNVDAWDMIEKPISRTVSLATKRGRSVKMEMGWILS
ncbi:hypothetical protein BGZ81_009121 [Podila clonocystis]|nr:hypothetical protein BGZ81_009121 [Podila clonocystis]